MELTRSSVGKKIIMAVSGGVFTGFLILHMIGNLKIFYGGPAFDHYSYWLRQILVPVLPEVGFLWILRATLVVAVIAHIWSATSLAIAARRARPIRYAHRPKVQASYAARTMRWGGVIILLFVIYHLLDLTTRNLNPVKGSTFGAVTADFAPGRWYVTLFYMLALVALGFHLRHGIWSAFQTMGWKFPRAAALVSSVVICGGFLVVPLAVTFGIVK